MVERRQDAQFLAPPHQPVERERHIVAGANTSLRMTS